MDVRQGFGGTKNSEFVIPNGVCGVRNPSFFAGAPLSPSEGGSWVFFVGPGRLRRALLTLLFRPGSRFCSGRLPRRAPFQTNI
jgi:hypothetical protein